MQETDNHCVIPDNISYRETCSKTSRHFQDSVTNKRHDFVMNDLRLLPVKLDFLNCDHNIYVKSI
jgi:hypothetical protein